MKSYFKLILFRSLRLGDLLRVYRVSDGKMIAAFRAQAPAPSHDGFALSPNASLTAVVADAQRP
jgi:hypothetical protein